MISIAANMADVSSHSESPATPPAANLSTSPDLGALRAAPKYKPIPWWTPRIWLGYRPRGWFGLLSRNGFRISPSRWHLAVAGTLTCGFNTLGRLAQSAIFGRRVAKTRIERPLFILGHWRTGTTLLHELLILDDRHGSPNNYQCFTPSHFLLSERLVSRLLAFTMPATRVMDNMKLGIHGPQEDEFALCALGLPSPYLSIAFPNESEAFPEYLDLRDLSETERDRWKRVFTRFLREIAFREKKRLVLKSPTHTARVKTLLEIFPDAQFAHIVRDPFVVYSSTIHLWNSLAWTQGLQIPQGKGPSERVLRTFATMYQRFEEDRELIPPGQLHELKYEDLVADPRRELRRLYENLNLGDFERVAQPLERYLDDTKGYKSNRFELDPETRAEIARRWAPVIQKYGYGREP